MPTGALYTPEALCLQTWPSLEIHSFQHSLPASMAASTCPLSRAGWMEEGLPQCPAKSWNGSTGLVSQDWSLSGLVLCVWPRVGYDSKSRERRQKIMKAEYSRAAPTSLKAMPWIESYRYWQPVVGTSCEKPADMSGVQAGRSLGLPRSRGVGRISLRKGIFGTGKSPKGS